MWEPNQEFLNILISMGISPHLAERALLHTANTSADSAAAWVFDNPNMSDLPLTEEEIEALSGGISNLRTLPSEASPDTTGGVGRHGEDEEDEESLPENYSGPYKMVFVVNMELGMGVGKIAAQVAHAALGLHRDLIDKEMEENKELGPLTCWEDYDGEKKIALKGHNRDHLLELMNKAKESGLDCYVVCDAGHTQVAPGSNTVLAVFGKEVDVNAVTGKLKLL